jgi:sensor histidine kinase YesM
MIDERFVSPPGALKLSEKKKRVTEIDIKEGKELFLQISKEENITPMDKETLELIRARKKHQTGTPATAQD